MGLHANKTAGRRIFEEKHYYLPGHVLPIEDFRLYTFRGEDFAINEAHRAALIKHAEEWSTCEFPPLCASEYMMYHRTGNRTVFGTKYSDRRAALMAFAVGEYLEGKGRFTDRLVDLVWLILEETSWVVPAHNRDHAWNALSLPEAYAGDVELIDLFSAVTGACLAFVYYFCRETLDAVNPVLCERLLYELDRRIVKPYLSDVALWNSARWSGYNLGNQGKVNNWCPWIVSNVLTVAALTVRDLPTRSVIVRRALPILDGFTATYYPDGGCDEGPGYWSLAGCALFNCCLLLYDMTGGYVNVFDDPLLKSMGEYAVKMVVTDQRVLNFADSSSQTFPNPLSVYEWGAATGSEMMITFGQSRLGGKPIDLGPKNQTIGIPYAIYLHYSEKTLPDAPCKPQRRVWLDGLVIAATRESDRLGEGLYVALKGGHNAESHNHNDIGNVIVFSDENPIFIDAGNGTYTKKSFSDERYTIWAMRSDHHNCATVNGQAQSAGTRFASTDEDYDEESGRLTMQLRDAYPAEAAIKSYVRSAVLMDGCVTLTDELLLEGEGEVDFHFLTTADPTDCEKGAFTLFGCRITYDPALSMRVEKIEKEAPETAVIPAHWETDAIRRITLTGKVPAEGKTFVITVKKKR